MKTLLPRLARQGALVAALLVSGYPLLWMAFTAVRAEGDARAAPFGLPLRPVSEGLAKVFSAGVFGRAYLNSLGVSVLSVALAVAFSSMAAYAFARMRFRGRHALFLLFLAGMMIPVHVTLVPLNRLLGAEGLGLKDTWFAIIGPYAGFALPISILILRGAFAQVPIELEEAARVDGCSAWGVFYHVALPLARPALATVVIFNFLTIWNEFAFALTLVTSRGSRTLPLALWRFRDDHGVFITETCAALCVAVLPVFLVYCLAQRHIIQGLTAGAVKQ